MTGLAAGRSATVFTPTTHPEGWPVTTELSESRVAATRTGPIAAAGYYASGFAMGCADLVPGVSGGTVALVVQVYERLVGNLRRGAGAVSRLLQADAGGAWERLRGVEWAFLAPLLAGVLSAVVVLAGTLRHLLEARPVAMSGLFFGLVAGSVVVALDELDEVTPRLVTIGAVVAGVTFVALGLRAGRVVDPSLPILFAGGAVAVCAMILPGISGSFILLILGLYQTVIAAVDDRDLLAVAVVGAGAAVGLGLFSTFLNWLLERHHGPVLAGLIGLMAGSLRVLWPWPAGGEEGVADTGLNAPVAADLPTVVGLAAVGVAGVLLLGLFGRRVLARG